MIFNNNNKIVSNVCTDVLECCREEGKKMRTHVEFFVGFFFFKSESKDDALILSCTSKLYTLDCLT